MNGNVVSGGMMLVTGGLMLLFCREARRVEKAAEREKLPPPPPLAPMLMMGVALAVVGAALLLSGFVSKANAQERDRTVILQDKDGQRLGVQAVIPHHVDHSVETRNFTPDGAYRGRSITDRYGVTRFYAKDGSYLGRSDGPK